MMYDLHKPNIDATALRIGLAVSRYHLEITSAMKDAAIDEFTRAGGNSANLHIVAAAGTFELTAVCRAMAMLRTRSGGPALDALVAIGCVLTGETTHDQYIAHAVTHGLTEVIVQTGVPIAFSVLTCQTLEQAQARSIAAHLHGGFNKGAEAMRAAIESAHTIRAIETSREFR